MRLNRFAVDAGATPPADCAKEGQTTAAIVVDHIVDHKGDQELFWNEDNWQSLCKPHHDAKTWRTHATVHRSS